MENNEFSRRKRSYILRAIMLTGTAYIVITSAVKMLCIPSTDIQICTNLTDDIVKVLGAAGITNQIFVGLTTIGSAIYYIFGKFKNN